MSHFSIFFFLSSFVFSAMSFLSFPSTSSLLFDFEDQILPSPLNSPIHPIHHHNDGDDGSTSGDSTSSSSSGSDSDSNEPERRQEKKLRLSSPPGSHIKMEEK